ncbi:MAG: amino acid adenylation domain-containing protein [Aquabacterium sp.]
MTSYSCDASFDMVRRLRALAAERPGDTALTVVHREGETRLSYAELDARSRALAAELQARFAPGDRALLLLDNDQHYVVAFFGCLYAGLTAVPVFPPESAREQHLARLVGIAADCQARCVLTSQAILSLVGAKTDVFGAAVSLAVDAIDDAKAPLWREHTPRPGDIAFLQYTSGSTAAPKGVMVTHANLMANERAIEESLAMQDDDVFVSWLPLYHDMGLIGGLLQPVYRGIPLVLMSPGFFLERPARWLEAISRHRGTISGGPDFAYRLCLERIKDEQLARLDLSSWRLAFSGAEPVRHDTLEAFVAHFASAGFQAGAVYPCYGLAEATLLVTGGRRGEGLISACFDAAKLAQGVAVPAASGTTLVACGAVPSAHALRIVDPESLETLEGGRIGEIWASGPSMAQGYWERLAESEETFVERDGQRWLRTGDLGFLHEGRLYVAGRRKDLIILRGHNVYPQDIERAIEAEVEAVRKGRVAAFAVCTLEGGEGIGVAVEVSRGLQKLVPPHALVEALNLAVSAVCHEPVAVALLLNPGALPKTSSGKLQRSACRQGWQARTLDAYAIHEHGRFVVGEGAESPTSEAVPTDELEQALSGMWRQVLKLAPHAALGHQAHFFSLGGNSLSTAQLASRIADQWGIDCPVRAVFEHARLDELAEHVRQTLKAGGVTGKRLALTPLPAAQRAEPLPLSHAQQRQWFLWQLEPQSTAYNIGGALRLTGELDAAALQAGFNALGQRHESLRTVFETDADGVAMQRILPAASLELQRIDLRAQRDREQGDEVQRQADAGRIAQELLDQPFDLTQGPLWRAALIQVADHEHILAVVAHHIVSDGASMQILLDELAALTLAHVQGKTAALASLPVQYADHAVWQRQWLDAGERDRQLAYWRRQLGEGDEQPVLALPTDHPRLSVAHYHAARHVFALPGALSAALRQVAQAKGASLFMALLAGFQALLYRSTAQGEVRVGVPIANRHRAEIEGLIGFFVNTQVLRGNVHGRLRMAQLLTQVRDTALEAQAHQDLPFDQLVDALQPERSLSHSPLFQVMFNHLREDLSALQQLPGITVEAYPLHGQAAQFELTLETREQADGGVNVQLIYARELFDEQTMDRFGARYVRLLQALVTHPDQALGDVDLLGEDELNEVNRWSCHEQAQPEPQAIHRLFERQVALHPHAPALAFGNAQLSYGELNQRANQWAHHLRKLGVGLETKVGIAAERSIEMVVGLMAILKAGGAYVPLDPDYPADRLAYMVEDSGIRLLLTQSHLKDRLPLAADLSVLHLDSGVADTESLHNPDVAVQPHNLVYMIYTSGSTGRPKGAANEHGALFNRLAWGQRHQPIGAGDTVLQKTPFSFDISFWEFFWPLTVGARLALSGPGDHRDPARLVALIQQHEVNTIHFVPSMLQAFMAFDGIDACHGLQRIVCSGEALPAELQNKVLKALPQVSLLNLYGPTEAAIEVTYWDCVDDGSSTVPIGRPIGNVSAWVLDGELHAVPRGVAGELYLGGVALARGYGNRPGLSSERFVADPFSEAGGRLYRTGDLVRWRADGQIEYLGRIDHQVKVRGFRIELGEVEAQLLARDGVREAVVVAQSGPSGTRLVAYVSGDAGADLDAAKLRQALGQDLPDYMVPSVIMVLAALPLNPNGKVDRKALPEPELGNEAGYVAPQGEVEQALAAVWQEVLGIAQVGRQDNFFELGGDSILSLQIVARARRAGYKLSPKQLFEHQRIAALALVAEVLAGADAAQSRQVRTEQPAQGEALLLPIQADFFERPVPARHHWNQAVLLQSSERLDARLLEQALQALVRHHDSLRLRYNQAHPDTGTQREQGGQTGQDKPGIWHQTYAEATSTEPLLWVRQARDADDVQQLCSQAQRSLDLSAGPLLRALLIEMHDGSTRLLLAIHHLVVDGVSWRILLEDLQAVYGQLAMDQGEAQPIALPPKTTSMQAWGQRLQAYARSHGDQLAHWQQLAGTPVSLPCDMPQGEASMAQQGQVSLKLDKATTRALLKDVPAAYRTQVNDVLLAALGRALCAWSGYDEILVDLEGHGREDLPGEQSGEHGEAVDLSRTVGWFTSLYPVRLQGQGQPQDTLKRTKEALRAIPHKGLGHGVLKHLGTPEQRQALQALPKPQVVFNYLGQFDSSFNEASLWKLAPESASPVMDERCPLEHALSINGQVQGGELEMVLGYSRARYHQGTIESLVNAYKAELQGLIAHCTSGVSGATPSDFPLAAAHGLTQAQLDEAPTVLNSSLNNIEDLYPLSPMQSGMLFHSVFEAGGNAYVNQVRLDIEGLDTARFKAAWQAAIARHAVLRTGFWHQREVPLQWVAQGRGAAAGRARLARPKLNESTAA